MTWKEVWEKLSVSEAQLFKRDGPDFDHESRRRIVFMCREIGGQVLECGFGSGIMFELILMCPTLEYRGVDVVIKFVRACKRMFPENAHKFMHGSIRELGFDSGSFDTVFCRSVIEHLPPHEVYASIHQMVRVASKQVILDFYRPPWDKPTKIFKASSGCWANTYHKGEIYGYLVIAGARRVEIIENIGENTVHTIFRAWK